MNMPRAEMGQVDNVQEKMGNIRGKTESKKELKGKARDQKHRNEGCLGWAPHTGHC